MVKVHLHTDCGNAPKKILLREINIAFAQGDVNVLTEKTTDDVCWDLVGQQRVEGRPAILKELEKMKEEKASDLYLDRILTHGREGAVSGRITLENGKSYAFADFYTFSSAKGARVKSITTYVLEV